MTRRQDPADRPPDVEIAAAVKADRLRFHRVPETEVTSGGDPDSDSVSKTERRNLPDEVRANRTYRDIEVRWGAAGWLRSRRSR